MSDNSWREVITPCGAAWLDDPFATTVNASKVVRSSGHPECDLVAVLNGEA
jgi:hypothetical protein